MRCKKHFADVSSAVGVCASCLRERLFTVIEAQVKAQAQVLIHSQSLDEHRKSDAIPPQIVFPRSVSPYISRRKSDNAAAWPQLQHSLSEQRFYSTPQVGPSGVIITDSLYKRRNGKFWKFSNLFRSKTQKFDLDPSFDSKSRKSYSTASTDATTASASWFSSIFSSKQKKKSRMSTLSFPGADQRTHREMSPTVELDDECGDGSSGYSSGSSPGWKETPQRATPQAHRGGRRQNQQRNVAGLVFCLSPLVRPSPNRNWSQKGMAPENTLPNGEIRAPAKPHLGAAATFRANRSRKLANFGRFHPNY